jgi:hypothetical protein
MRPAAATPGASAALHVFISDPTLFKDLCAFLQRADCAVGPRQGQYVEVELPLAYSKGQARRELDIYLATWQVTNPGVEVYVVDRDRAA